MPDPFADRLRELRTARGMSQSQLAHELGMDHSIVSRWESGDRSPSLDAVEALVWVLGDEHGTLVIAAGYLPRRMRVLVDEHGADYIADVFALVRAYASQDPESIAWRIQVLGMQLGRLLSDERGKTDWVANEPGGKTGPNGHASINTTD